MPELYAWVWNKQETGLKTHNESSYICDLNQVQHLSKNKNILRETVQEITSLAGDLKLVDFLGSSRLMGVNTAFRLKIPAKKAECKVTLAKLVYLLQWGSSINKQDVTYSLHTRYFLNNGGTPGGNNWRQQ